MDNLLNTIPSDHIHNMFLLRLRLGIDKEQNIFNP